jgi:hypothetical protein
MKQISYDRRLLYTFGAAIGRGVCLDNGPVFSAKPLTKSCLLS